MKIAVIGSRTFKYKEIVFEILCRELSDVNTEVITGGAIGVDSWVEEFCKEDCTPCEIVRPINLKDRIFYIFRNVEIITKADKIIAFWDGKSRGTKFVIDYALARNKPLKIIGENGKEIAYISRLSAGLQPAVGIP